MKTSIAPAHRLNNLSGRVSALAQLMVLATLVFAAPGGYARITEDDEVLARDANKKWRNAAIISHLYARGLKPYRQSVNLTIDETRNEPVFEVFTRDEKENKQPGRLLWTIEKVADTKFFRLRNLKSDQYLARKAGETSLELKTAPPRGASQAWRNWLKNTNAQWYIQSLTNSGDSALYNRSGSQEFAIVFPSVEAVSQARQRFPVSLGKIQSPERPKHLFKIESRYLEVALTPIDIERGTCLVHLANGAPMEGFTTPTPSEMGVTYITRRFRISIQNNEMGQFDQFSYDFVNDIGFDPLNTQNEAQQNIVNDLAASVSSMRLVEENDLDPVAIANSFMAQLSNAYNNDSESAAVVFFPDSLARLTEDMANNLIEKDYQALADKTLAMMIKTHGPILASYSYAFLVKRSRPNGEEKFIFVDPTDTTKPQKPTGDSEELTLN